MLASRLSVIVLLGTLLAAAPLAGQDVAGTWVLSVQLDSGGGDATFVLTREDGALHGTYQGLLGEHEVEGTVDGQDVTFSFEVEQLGKVTYRGSVDGDTMKGTCEYGALGTFEGKKSDG